MSQFFKALEQAERDRLREKEAAAANAPASPATPKPTAAPVVETTVASPVKPTSPKPPVTTPVAKPDFPVTTPASRLDIAATAPVSRPDFPAPSTPRPEVVIPAAPLYHAPSPASGFRPALRVRGGFRPGRRGHRQPLLIAQLAPNSIEADSYRMVRAKIELMASDRSCRHVAVTSVTNGDGKSTSAANLAVVAAQGGRRVCLVDGDLRRPTLHDLFNLPNVEGLASALAYDKPLHTVAKPSDIENLSIVVAGRSSHESFQDLLRPERLGKILQESESLFDLILFDTPPVIAVADTLSFASVCDGVILVVRSGSVPFSVLRRAVEQIGHVRGRVLGVLLNRVNLRATDADFYRYYRAYHATGPKA
jgi:protein-tyrosine kinase